MTDNTSEILRLLREEYPNAKAQLDYKNAFELLIAAVLSAQCTDKRVNIVTARLFEEYPTAEEMARLSPEELEPYIKTCGLYHAKAKNIIGACRMIVERFKGQVPRTMEELVMLPGVGRKVANVVLANAFDIPAIAVDTHVFRVSNRSGLANASTVEKTEKQLMEKIPQDMWKDAHHILIFHGRQVCSAQRPKCDICRLKKLCKYYNEKQA